MFMLYFTHPSNLAVNCGPLTPPLNGRVLVVPGTSLGAIAAYNCLEGYLLLGTMIRTCQANGEWSGEQPRCSCKSVSSNSEWVT